MGEPGVFLDRATKSGTTIRMRGSPKPLTSLQMRCRPKQPRLIRGAIASEPALCRRPRSAGCPSCAPCPRSRCAPCNALALTYHRLLSAPSKTGTARQIAKTDNVVRCHKVGSRPQLGRAIAAIAPHHRERNATIHSAGEMAKPPAKAQPTPQGRADHAVIAVTAQPATEHLRSAPNVLAGKTCCNPTRPSSGKAAVSAGRCKRPGVSPHMPDRAENHTAQQEGWGIFRRLKITLSTSAACDQ